MPSSLSVPRRRNVKVTLNHGSRHQLVSRTDVLLKFARVRGAAAHAEASLHHEKLFEPLGGGRLGVCSADCSFKIPLKRRVLCSGSSKEHPMSNRVLMGVIAAAVSWRS